MSKWDAKLPMLRQMAKTHTPEEIAEALGTTVVNTHKIAQCNNIALRRPAADPSRIKTGVVEHIAPDQLRPDPNQPRRTFNTETLKALGHALEQHQESPIKVRLATPEDGKGAPLIIKHGERRWRAAQLAGLTTVQVLLDDAPAQDAAERLLSQIDDNVQREDINPMDLAAAYRMLHEDYGVPIQAIAERVGSSRPVVSNLIRLLHLPDQARAMINNGWLTPSHGKHLLGIKCDHVRTALIEHLEGQQTKGSGPGNINALLANAVYEYTTRHIDLSAAGFDTATTCSKCSHRHTIKPSDSPESTHMSFCTERQCFEAHQNTDEPRQAEPTTEAPPTATKSPASPPATDQSHQRAEHVTPDSSPDTTQGEDRKADTKQGSAGQHQSAPTPTYHSPAQQERMARHALAQKVRIAAANADQTMVAIIIGLAAFGAEANGEEEGLTLQQVEERIKRDGMAAFLTDVAAQSVEWLRHHEVEAVATRLGLTHNTESNSEAA